MNLEHSLIPVFCPSEVRDGLKGFLQGFRVGFHVISPLTRLSHQVRVARWEAEISEAADYFDPFDAVM